MKLRMPVQGMILSLLAGCSAHTVSPSSDKLMSGIADWHAPLPSGAMITAPGATADLGRWWQALGDDTLNSLIRQALQNNQDLATARSRLLEVRARTAITASNNLPTLTASASASNSKTGSNAAQDHYQAGFDAGWEPDIFGGQRHAREAAAADLDTGIAAFNQTRISLLAEVARNYIELRSLQARVAVARANVDNQEETLALSTWRAQAGLSSQLNAEQARSTLAQTEAQIPALQTSVAAARHRLAVLLGVPPGTLPGLEKTTALPLLPEKLVIAIPADTLRQRPDIIAAERKLAAETARSGQSVANLYPSFKLSGSFGLQAVSLGGGDVFRTLAASIGQTVFDGGKRWQQVAIQDAVQQQALSGYRATVLGALEEVENALTGLSGLQQRCQSLATAATAARNAAALAGLRYQAGNSDFQTVLDTQRAQLSLEDSRQSCEADRLTTLIQLYKALGGGWSAADDASTPASGKSS